jgi:ribose-phosphate pyrophosphokinase
MKPLVFHLPGDEAFAEGLVRALRAERAALQLHRFPDGESLVRLDADVTGRTVVIVASLAQPDVKALPLLFAADAARDLGATRVLLAAPYLAYLRQDRRFNTGEAITSRTFAALVSTVFDGVVTVDPHLHRYHSLGEIYRVPTRVVQSAPAIAAWVAANVDKPVLIGPDAESEQWVQEVARGPVHRSPCCRRFAGATRTWRSACPALRPWPVASPCSSTTSCPAHAR